MHPPNICNYLVGRSLLVSWALAVVVKYQHSPSSSFCILTAMKDSGVCGLTLCVSVCTHFSMPLAHALLLGPSCMRSLLDYRYQPTHYCPLPPAPIGHHTAAQGCAKCHLPISAGPERLSVAHNFLREPAQHRLAPREPKSLIVFRRHPSGSACSLCLDTDPSTPHRSNIPSSQKTCPDSSPYPGRLYVSFPFSPSTLYSVHVLTRHHTQIQSRDSCLSFLSCWSVDPNIESTRHFSIQCCDCDLVDGK